MRIQDFAFLALSALIALFGLLMVLGAALQWSEGDRSAGNMALATGLGIFPILGAGWWTRSILRGAKRRRREQLERHVLHLAQSSGGRLTPNQVAQATTLTLEESKAFLDRLHLNGHCQVDLAENGVLSYTFTH